MPVYTYRRADGTIFDYKQHFGDEPLKVDPATGQPVVRVVQAAGIIFKGSGFYVNDSRSASKRSLSSSSSNGSGESSTGSTGGESSGSADKPAAEAVKSEAAAD